MLASECSPGANTSQGSNPAEKVGWPSTSGRKPAGAIRQTPGRRPRARPGSISKGGSMFLAGLILVLGVSGAAYFIGTKEGRQEEQKFVAKVLADYYTTDKTAQAFVQRLLGSLKSEYTKAFNDVVKFYDEVKKAL
jgi:hypothetical protein